MGRPSRFSPEARIFVDCSRSAERQLREDPMHREPSPGRPALILDLCGQWRPSHKIRS
jgi:hypothetical protein